MKVTLLHGENIAKLEERKIKIIDSLKKRGWAVTYLDGQALSIREAMRAEGLFGYDYLYISTATISDGDLAWLREQASFLPGNLLFISHKTLPKSFVNKLPQETNVEEFPAPKVLFRFLDSLYPGSAISTTTLDDVLKSTPLELLLAMLGRQLKDLYITKKGTNVSNMPSWKRRKLEYISNRFVEGQVEAALSDLSQLDHDIKVGKEDFKMGLERFIVNLTNA